MKTKYRIVETVDDSHVVQKRYIFTEGWWWWKKDVEYWHTCNKWGNAARGDSEVFYLTYTEAGDAIKRFVAGSTIHPATEYQLDPEEKREALTDIVNDMAAQRG